MKKIIFILLAATLPLASVAQTKTFGQLQEKYAGRDGYTIIEITQAMLDLLNKEGKNEQVSRMIGAINGINQITIIIAESGDSGFTEDMKKVVAESEYKLLTSVNENGQSVLFHYKDEPAAEKKGDVSSISELIMVMYGSADNLIMRIEGDFSINQIKSAVGGDGAK